MEKVVKRGYVKWTDENGVFHKEPLADHADMLAQASDLEKLRAEEVRRLNDAADVNEADRDKQANEEAREALQALKAAPEEVLTVSQLDESEQQEEVIDEDLHKQALEELREKTKED